MHSVKIGVKRQTEHTWYRLRWTLFWQTLLQPILYRVMLNKNFTYPNLVLRMTLMMGSTFILIIWVYQHENALSSCLHHSCLIKHFILKVCEPLPFKSSPLGPTGLYSSCALSPFYTLPVYAHSNIIKKTEPSWFIFTSVERYLADTRFNVAK